MRKYAFTILFLNCLFAHAQTLPDYIHVQTPEVTAFEKHIETPVSMYTGIPNINIPLYDIQIKGVKIPISLNYHAGGIRVDQEATWVGLGWDLSYGGNISRVVRGAPDEKFFLTGNGTLSTSNIDAFNQLTHLTAEPGNGGVRYDAVRQAKNKATDFMPDNFYYSALGYSGKFMFSQEQNKFILFPKDDIAVNYTYDQQALNSNNIRLLYSWNLKLPDGTSVDFGKGATTTSYTDHDNIANQPVTTNSWFVKTIKNVDNDSVTFNYENFSYSAYKISGQSYSYGTPTGTQTYNTNIVDFYYTDSRPTSINFPNGYLNFVTSTRTDSPTKKLDEVDVYNSDGGIVETIKFRYSYFYGNSYDMAATLGNWQNYVPDSYRYYRLRLDGIDIIGNDGASIKSYKFDYYSSLTIPSKWSFAQDHWGFYNGKANVAQYSFIPNFFTLTSPGFTGGDRRADGNYSNVFTLKSVTYPEGGKTEYIYENNTVGLTGIPLNFLQTFQDNNLLDKTATITIAGNDRLNSTPAPGSTSGNVRYYYNYFTVNDPVLFSPSYSWTCSTNFGISSFEQSMTPANNNVKFMLEHLVGSTWTEIKEFNTNQGSGKFVGTDNEVLRLPSGGSYRLTAALTYTGTLGSQAENQPYTLSFGINWREINPATKMVNSGGLRVKDINYRLVNGNIVKKKHYDYINPYADATIPTYTSGRVVSFPYYYQPQTNIINFAAGGDYWKEVFSSNSNQPMETTSGSYSGYEYVNEIDVDSTNSANNLKTVNHFLFNGPYYSQYYPMMNMAAWEPEEWTRGELLSTQYYKGNNVLKEEDYDYYWWSPNLANQTNEDFVQEINTDLISFQYLQRISGATSSVFPYDFYDTDPILQTLGQAAYYTGWHYGVDTYNQVSLPPPNPPYAWSNVELPYFIHYTGINKPKSKTTISYDSGHPITEVENYFYEKTPTLYQTTKTQTFSSTKDTLETRIKYPIDSSSVSVYTHMLSRHILTPVIVQQKFKNSLFLQSANTNYKQWTDTSILAPVRLVSQTGTGTPYVTTVYKSYDNKANILSASKAGGPPVSYQYGYNGQYPVAAVSNASNNDIFYESFEEEPGNTLYGDSKTGNYSYSGVYTKTLTGLDNGSYLLSYWQKSGSSWALMTTTAAVSNGSYTISINAQIDDIRFHPANAMMTTYTYNPLIGITSITDQKEEITYYEYDGLKRLINIKDKDGNITKSFCYNYGSQLAGCFLNIPTFTSSSQSIPETKSCSAGYTGTTVYYNLPLGKYISHYSQADADNQATDDVNENAQTYGNANGTCLLNITFTLSNTTNSGYQVSFSGGPVILQPFNFLNSGTTTIQIPTGTYNIDIYPTGAYVNHTITLGNRTPVVTPRTSFSGVSISTGSTDLKISIQ